MLLFGGNVPRVATPSTQSQGTSTWESVNGAKFLARSTDLPDNSWVMIITDKVLLDLTIYL